MKLAIAFACIAWPIMAQQSTTPVVSAGIIYQAAAANGITYIAPISGQAIIDQKAALNWKTILGQVLGDGSIGVLTGGLAGVIKMGVSTEVALAAGHAFYDHSIAPILAASAPNPGNIAPVLQITGTMAPSQSSCAENSIYATSVSGISAKRMLKSKAKSAVIPTILIGGLNVTFTPQGVQVLKNIAGSVITQFQVIDVIACVPMAGPPTGFKVNLPEGTSYNIAKPAVIRPTVEPVEPVATIAVAQTEPVTKPEPVPHQVSFEVHDPGTDIFTAEPAAPQTILASARLDEIRQLQEDLATTAQALSAMQARLNSIVQRYQGERE